MSWRDKIDATIVVVTGDRKRYNPLWKPSNKKITYNVSSFNFPNVNGTLVKKFQPQGATYPMEFYFQGEDHLDISEEFRKSCEDTRHWHIIHPFYGDLRVQPTELTYNNENPNLTIISGVFLETLPNDFPNNTYSPEDLVFEKKQKADLLIASNFEANSVDTSQSNLVYLSNSVETINRGFDAIIVTDEDANNFKNLYETTKRKINTTTYDSIEAITAIQEMINYPSTVLKSVQDRVNVFIYQINRLDTTIKQLKSTPKNLKIQYESLVSSLLGALCLVVSNKNDNNDYGTKKKVIEIIDQVISIYNKYNETIDSLQSTSSQELDSYIPDYNSNTSLNDLINYTISNLFDIALNAKKEQNIYLEDDSDIINLTHRFLGLDTDDINIDEFINNNEIGISEHLLIKKGRLITYYV